MTTLRRLDDVCEILMGQAPTGDAYNTDGVGWPLIAGAGDFGEVFPFAKKFTTEASKLSQRDDIILGIRASIGDKVLSDGVYCLGRGVAGLRPREELDNRYLWHWLSSVRSTLASKAKGATFKQVSRVDIGELTIPLPPLSVQRRIADILDLADVLRAKRRAALVGLDTLTVSVFVDMFGHPASMEVDGSWQRLGDSLTFVTSGSRGWAQYYADSGSRFIRSLDVRMNRIANDAAAFVNPPESAEARRTRVESGDVLLTITGSRIGRISPVPRQLQGAYISQHVAILRLDQQRLTPEFVSFFLALDSGGQRQIARTQYGQTKPGLNLEQIRELRVPVAPLALQLEFGRRLSMIQRLESGHRSSLCQLDTLFASLRNRAFRGEL